MTKKNIETTAPTKAKVSARVEAILAHLSLAEKIGQLTQVGNLPVVTGPKPEEIVRQGGAGSVLWLNDAQAFNALQKIAVEESPSKIPLIFGLDVIHGYRTIFPVPLALAASWDPAVAERAQAVAAKEARAAGIHWTFAPMLDIARDARWGRIVEGAGEDPCLGAAMAAAQVRGFQGPDFGAPDRVVACAKHFAGYGAADGGRDYDPVYLSETQLRNTIFPPFQAAVEAGVGTFMSAYMDLNDVPASGNRWLLTDVLRGEWGFEGFVVSDAFAVGSLVTQGFAADGRDAARRALNAGLDMDMASNTYLQHLAGLVEDGSVKLADIDAAVRRILAIKVRLGLFEQPYADEAKLAEVAALPEHRQEARLAAQRSMVLLRNEGASAGLTPLLPLAKSLQNVAVIGPLADSMEATEGSWMVFGHTPAAVTVLAGIRAKLPGAVVTYAPGPEIRRDIASWFEANMPSETHKPVQSPEQAEAAFRAAVATAARRGPRGDGAGRARQHDRRGRVARLARPAGTPGGAAQGGGGARQAGGPRAPERQAAEHLLGRRERAGDPRGVGAGQRRRQRGGRHPVRRCEPGRQAARHLPPPGQPRAALLRAQHHALARRPPDVQPALLGRPAHAALPLRLRPQLHDLRDHEPEDRPRATRPRDGDGRRDEHRPGGGR